MENNILTSFDQQNLNKNSEGNLDSPLPSVPEVLIQNLDKTFQEVNETSRTSKLRQLLGNDFKNIPDEYLETVASQIEFLVGSWMDSFEREIFAGNTLKEVLNEDVL